MNWLSLIPILNVKTIAGVLAIVQAIIKAVKEILTAIIDAALPFIKQESVQKIRDVINKVDAVVEGIKNFFLKLAK